MKEEKNQREQLPEPPREFLKNFDIKYLDDDVALISDIEIKKRLSGFRTTRNLFYFCHQGELVIETPDGQYTLHRGETFVCPTGTYLKLKYADPNSKFSALGLTDRIIQSLLNTNMHLWNNIVYVLKERIVRPAVNADIEQERSIMWHYAELINGLLQLKERPFKQQMIYLVLQMGLLGFCAYYKETTGSPQQVEAVESGATQSQILFTKFMELLQNEKVKHQPVAYYADKLCISSKYLSYVCKTVSGKSASDFIQNAVVGEIMHYLENTTLSVKEISNLMGFQNISFFGKFVKTHLGVSPNKYRK